MSVCSNRWRTVPPASSRFPTDHKWGGAIEERGATGAVLMPRKSDAQRFSAQIVKRADIQRLAAAGARQNLIRERSTSGFDCRSKTFSKERLHLGARARRAPASRDRLSSSAPLGANGAHARKGKAFRCFQGFPHPSWVHHPSLDRNCPDSGPLDSSQAASPIISAKLRL